MVSTEAAVEWQRQQKHHNDSNNSSRVWRRGRPRRQHRSLSPTLLCRPRGQCESSPSPSPLPLERDTVLNVRAREPDSRCFPRSNSGTAGAKTLQERLVLPENDEARRSVAATSNNENQLLNDNATTSITTSAVDTTRTTSRTTATNTLSPPLPRVEPRPANRRAFPGTATHGWSGGDYRTDSTAQNQKYRASHGFLRGAPQRGVPAASSTWCVSTASTASHVPTVSPDGNVPTASPTWCAVPTSSIWSTVSSTCFWNAHAL